MDLRELHADVEQVYYDYVECLDDDELERWPDFFTDECLYKIIPRENFDRGLPLATMLCESRGMLEDRVVAVRKTSVYVPRALRHLVSNIRIKGEEQGAVRAQANYLVLETIAGEETRVFNTGKYIDTLVREEGRLRFREKLCVFDSVVVPGSIIYPI